MAKTITMIDRRTAVMMEKEIKAALAGFEKKFGVTVQMKGGRFGPYEFQQKILILLNETYSGKSAQEERFSSVCFLYGLKPEDFGREFEAMGNTFRLTGFATKAKRFPVLAEEVTSGSTYKFTRDVLQKLKKKSRKRSKR